jgi:hypothetical protein
MGGETILDICGNSIPVSSKNDDAPLGNASDAALAQSYYDGYAEFRNGWKELGSGCYRTCYLSPDGIVYKVQSRQSAESPNYNSNSNEVRNYKLLAKYLPERISLARCYEWTNTVSAMVFVSNNCDVPYDVNRLLDTFKDIARMHVGQFGQHQIGLNDIAFYGNHAHNFGWEDDGIVVFDYAQ